MTDNRLMSMPFVPENVLQLAAGICAWSWLPLTDEVHFDEEETAWGQGTVPAQRSALIESLWPGDQAAFAEALDLIRVAPPGSQRSVEHRVPVLGSTLRRYRTHLLRAETVEGAPRVLALSLDISRDRALEDQVDLLFERAPVGIVFLGADGRLYRPNPALVRLLGYGGADEIEALAASDLILPGEHLRDPADPNDTSPPQVLHYLRHRHGDLIPVKVFESELREGDGRRPGTLLQIVNRTTETRIRAHLEDAANRDWVTGLFNQRYLLQRLDERLQKRAQRPGPVPDDALGLLSLNLSGFRQVIDLAGHLAGDQVLREVSYLLLRGLSEDDDLFRSGGDYFFALIQRSNLAEIEATALDLLREVKDHSFVVEGVPLRLLATAGLRQVHPVDEGPVQLIADADAACRAAKRIERGTLRAFSDTDRSVDTEVKAAVRLKRLNEATLAGSFVTIAEPLMRCANGCLAGHELLTRLRREDGGLESIGSYLQAAERAFSAAPVDLEILRHTLPRLQLWAQRVEIPPFFTINLSAHSLQSERFLDTLLELLETHPLPRDSLYFELTETAAVTQPDRARSAVERLQARGTRLIVDDFGAGFSSLGSLMELGVAGLKLDRSLTGGIVEDPVRRKVVKALVQLAHSLGGFVIAEGVETADEHRAAIDIGTDYLQGFYFGAGVPIDDLPS